MNKQFLKNIREGQLLVNDLLEYALPADFNDKHITQFFEIIQQSSVIANSAIVEKIADYYQLLNEENNYTQISLNEIGELYEEILKAHPFDISFYESAYFFYKNVLDDEDKANTILIHGLKIINKRITSLKTELG